MASGVLIVTGSPALYMRMISFATLFMRKLGTPFASKLTGVGVKMHSIDKDNGLRRTWSAMIKPSSTGFSVTSLSKEDSRERTTSTKRLSPICVRSVRMRPPWDVRDCPPMRFSIFSSPRTLLRNSEHLSLVDDSANRDPCRHIAVHIRFCYLSHYIRRLLHSSSRPIDVLAFSCCQPHSPR